MSNLEKLLADSALARAALRTCGFPLAILDATLSGRPVVYANPAFEKFFGLRSDEAMVSVLAHELTHIASGQADSLRLLFRAIARRAAARTGLRIQGQRAEELGCDLVGVMAARAFIKQTPSWEPLSRRLARAFEHNCVDDDASDEDHLSPRNTIRALFTLDVSLASEELSDASLGAS